MKKIILVEDETYIREEMIQMLIDAEYDAYAITNFVNVSEQILAKDADLIMLDINLPNASGFEICRDIKHKSSVPVLVLTSRDEMSDELKALNLGADEYLTKPCRKERILARIANVLKRYEGRNNMLEGEGILLDRNTYTLYIDGNSVILPKNQGKMLEVFLLHSDNIVTKEELSMAIWGTTEYIDENALQVNIVRLRKNLKNLNMKQRIEAVAGKGYVMKDD